MENMVSFSVEFGDNSNYDIVHLQYYRVVREASFCRGPL